MLHLQRLSVSWKECYYLTRPFVESLSILMTLFAWATALIQRWLILRQSYNDCLRLIFD